MRDKIKDYGGSIMDYVVGKSVVSSILACLGFLFGGWDILLQIFLVVMLIDILTGFMASYASGVEITSKKMYLGGFKKLSMWLLIIVAVMVDTMLGLTYIRFLVVIYNICTEILSIFDNVDKLGTGVPSFVKDLIKSVLNKVNEGKHTNLSDMSQDNKNNSDMDNESQS